MDLSSKKMGAAVLILGVFGIISLSMNLLAPLILRNDAIYRENTGMNMSRSDIVISDLKIVENTPSIEINKNPSLLEKGQLKEFLLTGAYLYESSGTASAHLDRQALNLDTLTPTSQRAWTSRPEVSVGICKKDRSACDRSFVQRISGQTIPVNFLLREGEIHVSFPTADKRINVTGLYEAESIPVIFN